MGSITFSPIGLALAITIAGGLGAVLRLLSSRWQGALPWGILTANTLASFLLGATLNFNHDQFLVFSALAGSLSTFSSFASQTSNFWSGGQKLRAVMNFGLNFALPYTGVLLGALLASTLLK